MPPIKWVNGVQLAAALGITKGRVSQLEAEGVFRRGLKKKFDLDESIKNYKNRKQNVKRIDRGPELPLPKPQQNNNTEAFKDEFNAAKSKDNDPLGNAHDQYVKLRAAREGLKYKKEKLEVAIIEERQVDKNPFMDAMCNITRRKYAKIKSKLMSMPKSVALTWPDPKERPRIEMDINEYVTKMLGDLSDVEPDELIEAVNSQA